ncbi:hypothetical protein V2I01_20200 [Micromonospora sp. BRA006-A]|nr:hypothetical protein [Micromonospora sp. BRA006-A]
MLMVLVLLGYPVTMERFAGGRTVGKLAVGYGWYAPTAARWVWASR